MTPPSKPLSDTANIDMSILTSLPKFMTLFDFYKYVFELIGDNIITDTQRYDSPGLIRPLHSINLSTFIQELEVNPNIELIELFTYINHLVNKKRVDIESIYYTWKLSVYWAI